MSIFCRGVFWFKHKWGDWSDKELIKLSRNSDKGLVGQLIVQERVCGRCKRKQLRSEKVDYI